MSKTPINVLFVCKGNIFRSVTAEYCCKKYCEDNNIDRLRVSSAGTEANNQTMDPCLIDTLATYDIDPTIHKQRKLTKELLQKADIVIPMTIWQKDMIAEHYNTFGQEIILFLESIEDNHTSLKDAQEAVVNYQSERDAVCAYIKKIVDFIYGHIEDFVNDMYTRFFLFEDLLQGKANHIDGIPFSPIYETTHATSFVSLDIPKYEDGHVLVVPKQRYRYIHEVPPHIMQEMMGIVQIIGKAFLEYHDGYNVLVNTGHASEQYIYHVHIHIIPRTYTDNIQMKNRESKKNLTKQEYLTYTKTIQQGVKKITQNL